MTTGGDRHGHLSGLVSWPAVHRHGGGDGGVLRGGDIHLGDGAVTRGDVVHHGLFVLPHGDLTGHGGLTRPILAGVGEAELRRQHLIHGVTSHLLGDFHRSQLTGVVVDETHLSGSVLGDCDLTRIRSALQRPGETVRLHVIRHFGDGTGGPHREVLNPARVVSGHTSQGARGGIRTVVGGGTGVGEAVLLVRKQVGVGTGVHRLLHHDGATNRIIGVGVGGGDLRARGHGHGGAATGGGLLTIRRHLRGHGGALHSGGALGDLTRPGGHIGDDLPAIARNGDAAFHGVRCGVDPYAAVVEGELLRRTHRSVTGDRLGHGDGATLTGIGVRKTHAHSAVALTDRHGLLSRLSQGEPVNVRPGGQLPHGALGAHRQRDGFANTGLGHPGDHPIGDLRRALIGGAAGVAEVVRLLARHHPVIAWGCHLLGHREGARLRGVDVLPGNLVGLVFCHRKRSEVTVVAPFLRMGTEDLHVQVGDPRVELGELARAGAHVLNDLGLPLRQRHLREGDIVITVGVHADQAEAELVVGGNRTGGRPRHLLADHHGATLPGQLVRQLQGHRGGVRHGDHVAGVELVHPGVLFQLRIGLREGTVRAHRKVRNLVGFPMALEGMGAGGIEFHPVGAAPLHVVAVGITRGLLAINEYLLSQLNGANLLGVGVGNRRGFHRRRIIGNGDRPGVHGVGQGKAQYLRGGGVLCEGTLAPGGDLRGGCHPTTSAVQVQAAGDRLLAITWLTAVAHHNVTPIQASGIRSQSLKFLGETERAHLPGVGVGHLNRGGGRIWAGCYLRTKRGLQGVARPLLVVLTGDTAGHTRGEQTDLRGGITCGNNLHSTAGRHYVGALDTFIGALVVQGDDLVTGGSTGVLHLAHVNREVCLHQARINGRVDLTGAQNHGRGDPIGTRVGILGGIPPSSLGSKRHPWGRFKGDGVPRLVGGPKTHKLVGAVATGGGFLTNRVPKVIGTGQNNLDVRHRVFTRVLHTVLVGIQPHLIANGGADGPFDTVDRPHKEVDPLRPGGHPVHVRIIMHVTLGKQGNIKLDGLTKAKGTLAQHTHSGDLGGARRAFAGTHHRGATRGGTTPRGAAAGKVAGILGVMVRVEHLGVQHPRCLGRGIRHRFINDHRVKGEGAGEAGGFRTTLREPHPGEDINDVNVFRGAGSARRLAIAQTHPPPVQLMVGVPRRVDLQHGG